MEQHPVVTFVMENGTEIVIELYPEEAPNTVNSFLHLAAQHCFDGHTIERIVPGYVVDASYRAFGQEACKYLIDNESPSWGHSNALRVEPGVIAMGGYGEDGIAAGEFFFPLAYHEKLDGHYPAFGKILSGMEEILRWETVPTRRVPYPGHPELEVNEPITPLVIRSVRAETFGVIYPAPVRRPVQNRPANW